MFLNDVLAHRFLGIWALLLSFFLVIPSRDAEGPAERTTTPGPVLPWVSRSLEAAAAWAWVAVLARGLPVWRVTMTWGGEGLVLFDSRAPLWAALGVWGLFRHHRSELAELSPYMLLAAWLADPEAFSQPWWAGGFQTFAGGEGLLNLLVLLLPVARWPGGQAPPVSGRNADLICVLVGCCFWGFLPTMAIMVAAAAAHRCSAPSWQATGAQALLVAAALEWLESGVLLPGSPSTAVATALLFSLGRILPIVGKMVF
ncbi:MAG: hypothetical protein GX442_10570 [Candidatus Riflebacteria bacterium]|nr:hypothetical protein [Candidatus Riflebacteria bacterium]